MDCVSDIRAVLAQHHCPHHFRDLSHLFRIQGNLPTRRVLRRSLRTTLPRMLSTNRTSPVSASGAGMKLANLLIAIVLFTTVAHAEQTAVWIGMSEPRHGEREGIYRAALDTATGTLTEPALAAEIGTPEFLAIHP